MSPLLPQTGAAVLPRAGMAGRQSPATWLGFGDNKEKRKARLAATEGESAKLFLE